MRWRYTHEAGQPAWTLGAPRTMRCCLLRRSGAKVPREVAVTGFDDIPLARGLEPWLTTVRQPVGEIGETAFASWTA